MPKSYSLKSQAFLWAALFAATCVTYLSALGEVALLGRDEPRYAQVGREMWLRGDWITPTLGGHLWFEKPALLYWLMILSFKIFGVHEWTVRLGPALAGIACAATLGWAGLRVEKADKTGGSAPLGLCAAGVLASSLGLLVFARGATFDVILTACLTLTFACFLAAELEESASHRTRLMAGFWVGIGLSLLGKGLIGLLLPALVIGLYCVLRRDWGVWRRCRIPWGLPLALAVAGLWYGPMFARHGALFWHEFFVRHHFQRFTSDEFRHSQPIYFFLPVFTLFTLPWTPFLISALWQGRPGDQGADSPREKTRALALCWMLVPLGFFSISGSKLPSYVLPALPGAALLIAQNVAATIRGENKGKALTVCAGLCLLLAGALIVYGGKHPDIGRPGALAVVWPLALAGLGIVCMGHFQKIRWPGIAMMAGATLLTAALLCNTLLEPVSGRMSTRGLLADAARAGFGETKLYNWRGIERTSEFYASGQVAYDEKGEPIELISGHSLHRELAANGRILVLVRAVEAPMVKQLAGKGLTFSADNGPMVILGLQVPKG